MGGYNIIKWLNWECKDGNIIIRCGWCCCKFEFLSFEFWKLFFFDRLGKGDNSFKVVLYVGDLILFFMEFDGVFKFEEGFVI